MPPSELTDANVIDKLDIGLANFCATDISANL